MTAPPFLITIDTEGDDLWSRPRTVTTRNAAFLERFQTLCEEHGLRPTWLVDYQMVSSPVFKRFASDVLERDAAEIGMHLHAWDSPPLEPLTEDDATYQPYLIEYPPRGMREKIHALTALLEDTFGMKMTSHRAGRWGFDERYAEMLIAEGYRVDCSVTPLTSWQRSRGAPNGSGGPDFRRFPQEPYWIDLADISRPGDSSLLEVPATVTPGWPPLLLSIIAAGGLAGRLANRVRPRTIWLRPDGRNSRHMVRLVDEIAQANGSHAEFVLHSSELMPGGSPTFRTEASIESLYADLRTLFAAVRGRYRGLTLRELHAELAASRR